MKTMALLIFFITSVLNLDFAQAKDDIQLKFTEHELTKLEPIITGRKFKFESKILDEEKEIYISLPENYDERTYKYPVVYVVEAEFLFTPTTVITKHMAMRNEIPQSIIIGIANGDHSKRSEMTLPIHGGKVYDHLKFLRNELIPYIEENFRANSHRTIIGLSPSTGIVLESFWTEPDIFTGYISLATHLTWPPRKGVSMIEQIIKTVTDKNHPKASIYFGIAEQDITRKPYETAVYEEAVDKLKDVAVVKVNFKLEGLKGEEHYGMALTGLRNGFKTIYPLMKPMNRFREADDPASEIRHHYEMLSQNYGFKTYPIQMSHSHSESLSSLASAFSRWKMHKKSINLFNLGIEYFPNSSRLHMGLAEVYQKINMPEKAVKAAEKAIKIATRLNLPELENYQQKLTKIGR
jgi:predicted alpha/beta superfamily hydrolase